MNDIGHFIDLVPTFLEQAGGSYPTELDGCKPLQPDASSRSFLLEIIEDRHGNRSTIITSQVPVNECHGVIGEQTIAGAILDRVVHNVHRMELAGESLLRDKETKSPKMLKQNK